MEHNNDGKNDGKITLRAQQSVEIVRIQMGKTDSDWVEWGSQNSRDAHRRGKVCGAATHTAKNFASLEKYKCSEHTWL